MICSGVKLVNKCCARLDTKLFDYRRVDSQVSDGPSGEAAFFQSSTARIVPCLIKRNASLRIAA